MVFHNGSNYVYRFIIKEAAKESEGKFRCLGENTEKYKNFSVPITKEVKGLIKMKKKLQNHVLQTATC